MLKKLTNNLWWKILSVILAFILWLFVVNYQDPADTKIFKGIRVEQLNVESEAFKNKSITYKEGVEVDIVVKGRRSQIGKMTEQDIRAYVDFNRISDVGAMDILVDVVDALADVQIISQTPRDMVVDLEDIISQQRRVQYIFEGVLPENYIALEPEFSPSYIEIRGPESKVKSVSSILVSIPIEGEEKDITLRAQPQILDNANNVATDIESNVDEIEVMVPIEKVKEVAVELRTNEVAASGYEITNLSLDQKKIIISGKASIVEEMNAVYIDSIQVSQVKENKVFTVSTTDLLPEGVSLVEGSKEIKVSVNVEPIIEKTIEISHFDITVKFMPENLQFSYLDEEVIEIKVSGIQKELDKVTLEYLSPYIRLYELEEGEHSLELFYSLPFKVKDVSEEERIVNVILEKAEEESENLDQDTESDSGETNSNESQNGN